MKRKILKSIKIVGIVLLAITAIFTIIVVVAGAITPLFKKREGHMEKISCCSFFDD